MTTRARVRALDAHMTLVAASMRRRALASTWDGRRRPDTDPYFRSCVTDDGKTGMRLIFTRDTGHHSSGWFKNPDYERCFHLSVSSWDPLAGEPTNHLDRRMAELWIRVVFGEVYRLAWREPAATPQGRTMGIEHWRLFCDEHWQAIHPRGEVYTLDFTEKGWKTYSQVRAETGITIDSPLNPYPE